MDAKAGLLRAPELPGFRRSTSLFCNLVNSVHGGAQVTYSLDYPMVWFTVAVTSLIPVQVSSAMGFGFRCGFLGLLHMEIVQERLEREYDLDLITTAPTVVYKCELPGGGEMNVDNPCNLPDKHDNLQEPYCRLQPGPPLFLRCMPDSPAPFICGSSMWAGVSHRFPVCLRCSSL